MSHDLGSFLYHHNHLSIMQFLSQSTNPSLHNTEVALGKSDSFSNYRSDGTNLNFTADELGLDLALLFLGTESDYSND
jgi:hypothetical protein